VAGIYQRLASKPWRLNTLFLSCLGFHSILVNGFFFGSWVGGYLLLPV